MRRFSAVFGVLLGLAIVSGCKSQPKEQAVPPAEEAGKGVNVQVQTPQAGATETTPTTPVSSITQATSQSISQPADTTTSK